MTNIIPGSIGPIKYYTKNAGPWKGDTNAYQSMDSGILFADWKRHNDTFTSYDA